MTDKELIITLRSMESRSKRAVLNAAADRLEELVAYKQTGMEPEELLSATDMAKVACALHELNAYKDLGPIDRLRELAQADREGRCVVLPCEVGSTVYMLFCGEVVEKRIGQFHVNGYTSPKIWADIDCDWSTTQRVRWDLAFGKTVFLTREEAEAALKEKER